MNTSTVDDIESYDIWQGRFAVNKARIWVFCPVQPGRIQVCWLDNYDKKRKHDFNRVTWKKYNNTFWWYTDILLNKKCINIQIHTMSPFNINMKRITKNLDKRYFVWNEITDAENIDYLENIDLTPGSSQWKEYHKTWDVLSLDQSSHMSIGTAYTFISFNKVTVGIAAL